MKAPGRAPLSNARARREEPARPAAIATRQYCEPSPAQAGEGFCDGGGGGGHFYTNADIGWSRVDHGARPNDDVRKWRFFIRTPSVRAVTQLELIRRHVCLRLVQAAVASMIFANSVFQHAASFHIETTTMS